MYSTVGALWDVAAGWAEISGERCGRSEGKSAATAEKQMRNSDSSPRLSRRPGRWRLSHGDAA